MTGLQLTWNDLARPEWDRLHAQSGGAYQQDWAYADALRSANPGLKILRAHVRSADGQSVAIAQILVRPFALVARFALCTLGPVWIGDVDAETKRAAVKLIRARLPLPLPRLMIVTPDEACARSAGLKGLSQVMTGDATVHIDLTPDESALRAGLESSWRNKLGKAEKSAIRVSKAGTKPGQWRWLLEAEGKQRSARGYRSLPSSLTEAWQASKLAANPEDKSGGVVVYRADLGREAAAGMIFLIHGSRATYHIGWTGEAGREHAAHNLMLWTAMLDLKERGIATLDLGGVNTQSGAGIARFKLGAGGTVLARAGSYA